jgi:hypothetical protein
MRTLLLLLAATAVPWPAAAQTPDTTERIRDRGDGLPLSMFGTYIGRHELVIYPFYEYYRDGDYEYEAGEL